MQIGPRHVFAHLPRAGGTFVGLLMQELHLATWTRRYQGHVGVRALIPIDRRRKLIFGVVRDPTSWYRSVYLHCLNRKTDEPRDRFENVLRTMLGPRIRPLHEVIGCLTHPRREGLDLTKLCRYLGSNEPPRPLLAELDRMGVGMWTWMVMQIFADHHVLPGQSVPWGVHQLIDHSHIRQGLIAVVGDEYAPRIKHHRIAHLGERSRATPEQLCLDGTDAWGDILSRDGWMMELLGLDRPADARPAVQVLSDWREPFSG